MRKRYRVWVTVRDSGEEYRWDILLNDRQKESLRAKLREFEDRRTIEDYSVSPISLTTLGHIHRTLEHWAS